MCVCVCLCKERARVEQERDFVCCIVVALVVCFDAIVPGVPLCLEHGLASFTLPPSFV